MLRGLLFTILLAPLLPAATEVELRWNELSPMITGKDINLVLPDGATIGGEALAVREDSLSLMVKRTSNKKLHAKGQASIPKEQIKVVDLRRPRSAAGRIALTIVGAFGGLTLGGLIAYQTSGGAAAWGTVVGLGAGGAVLGYFTGDEIDRRTTRIKIVDVPTVTTRPVDK